MKKERITFEDRILIENLLRENYKLKDIARIIGKHSSTISREIKNRRLNNGATIICPRTNKFPFICQTCSKKYNCRMRKYYYNSKKAQEDYDKKLKESRIGIDMSIDEIEYWNDFFRERLKNKNQPILHIFNEIEGSFPKTIQSFYNYVHKGCFPSINDEMLPRSFNYKPRKKKEIVKTISKDNVIKKGRRYEDFLNYMSEHPNTSVVEMDTVIGKFDDVNCIMTLYFRDTRVMLLYYIKKYKPQEVTKVFNSIKSSLGEDLFKQMFEIVLTDNGWEFSKPEDIEFNYETGEKLTSVYYCEPYSSWQKGGIERNHEFIRYIIPKGITFDFLTKKNITDMMNHINNVSRKSLNFNTPYQTFEKKYGKEICKALNLKFIPSKDVNLSYKLIQK